MFWLKRHRHVPPYPRALQDMQAAAGKQASCSKWVRKTRVILGIGSLCWFLPEIASWTWKALQAKMALLLLKNRHPKKEVETLLQNFSVSSHPQTPQGSAMCTVWLAWLSPLGFRSYAWKMSSSWYSLNIKLRLGVMWICYDLLRWGKRQTSCFSYSNNNLRDHKHEV